MSPAFSYSLQLAIGWLLLSSIAGRSIDDARHCSYGSLPGLFELRKPEGERWTLLTPRCQLRNLLSSYLSSSPAEAAPEVDLLFLSDSVDGFLMKDACTRLGNHTFDGGHIGDAPWYQEHCSVRFFCSCSRRPPRTSPIRMGLKYITSVHSSGTHMCNSTTQAFQRMGTAAQRSADGLREYEELYGRRPSIIVMQSVLWDMERMMFCERRRMAEVLKSPNLPVAVLQQYMKDLRTWIQAVKKMIPGVPLVYRTTIPPATNHHTGMLVHPHLGRASHLAEMNAAGLQVAMDENLTVIHYHAMAASWQIDHERLRDLHHPVEQLTLELLNLILNIHSDVYSQPKRRGAPAAGDESKQGPMRVVME